MTSYTEAIFILMPYQILLIIKYQYLRLILLLVKCLSDACIHDIFVLTLQCI